MNKIFLDTNVWLRFLLNDHQQSADCFQLMTEIEAGKYKAYTSDLVFLEINYVLTDIYKIPKKQVATDLTTLRETRGLTIINQTNLSDSLALYQKTLVKFSDCLIATQTPEDCQLCTYDQEFKKIVKHKSLILVTPPELI